MNLNAGCHLVQIESRADSQSHRHVDFHYNRAVLPEADGTTDTTKVVIARTTNIAVVIYANACSFIILTL